MLQDARNQRRGVQPSGVVSCFRSLFHPRIQLISCGDSHDRDPGASWTLCNLCLVPVLVHHRDYLVSPGERRISGRDVVLDE